MNKKYIDTNNNLNVIYMDLPESMNVLPKTAYKLPITKSLTPQHDVDVICKIVTALQPKTVLEIGTAQGYTTRAIALNMPSVSSIYTIDFDNSHKPTFCRNDEIGIMHKNLDNIIQLYGDCRTFPYHQVFDEKFDLIFIDGSHEYNNIIIDTYRALMMVGRGACLIWHDYNNPYPTDRVTAAVNDMIYNIPGQIIHINNTWLALVIIGQYDFL